VAVLGLTGGKAVGDQRRPAHPRRDRLGRDPASPNAYVAMIRLMRSGAVDVKPLLTDIFSLDQVRNAFTALESRTAIRPIIPP
jgi:threonine dehydrogenase-like Zn-dependent dehydrogenase